MARQKLARKLSLALIAACFPFAGAHAAPACIDNLVGMNDAVVIDASTLLIHKAGEGYKRITVVNHPLEPDDERLHHPYALCVGDRVAPFGVERGVSVITDISGITTGEADTLREAIFIDRVKYRALPRNRLNSLRAGRIGDLCNDARLTSFQIKQCSDMMREAQTAEARTDVRDTVRFIIKKRQSLANRRSNFVNESAQSAAFYHWSATTNAPPPSPPQHQP